jgi:hypothetical protein
MIEIHISGYELNIRPTDAIRVIKEVADYLNIDEKKVVIRPHNGVTEISIDSNGLPMDRPTAEVVFLDESKEREPKKLTDRQKLNVSTIIAQGFKMEGPQNQMHLSRIKFSYVPSSQWMYL